MDIQALIFDLDGTLIEYAGPFSSWPELETSGLHRAYNSLKSKGVELPEFNRYPYLKLFDQLGVEAQYSVFISDDPANDMIGGQRAGLRTVLMQSGQRFPQSEDVRLDAVITHLNEVPALLSLWSNE